MNFGKKINLSIIIFIFLSVGLIFLLFSFFSQIREISNQIVSEKQKYLLLEKRAENAGDFQRFYEAEKLNFQKLDSIFINSELPLEFIAFLEKISQDSGIYLKKSFSPFTKTQKDPWSSLLFQLNATGSTSNFLKFMEKFESSQYLIQIQNLSIARISEKDLKTEEGQEVSLGDIKANLAVKVYSK